MDVIGEMDIIMREEYLEQVKQALKYNKGDHLSLIVDFANHSIENDFPRIMNISQIEAEGLYEEIVTKAGKDKKLGCLGQDSIRFLPEHWITWKDLNNRLIFGMIIKIEED